MGIDMDDKRATVAAVLRRRAEESLRAETSNTLHPPTEAESIRLSHELEVHQIELEMQNAELRGTQEELEQSRDKYAEPSL